MRRAIVVVLVLAFIIGAMPSFSTPAHAWGFNFASIYQSAANVFVGAGCFLYVGYCDIDQTIVQVGNIYQR